MTANILAGHRKVPPYGVNGGEPGEVGRNYVQHVDGKRTELGYHGQVHVQPGDQFVIETPGGGGFGAIKTREE